MGLLSDTAMLAARDGTRLFVHQWRPSSHLRGVVCALHGHGEHGGRHAAFAQELARVGLAVLAMDLRGHGRSEGKRGHTPAYERYLDDVDTLLAHAAAWFPDEPRFLYGHSLGGNIALNHALRRPEAGVARVVATCPWLRLTHEISALRVLLASIVNPLWPSFTVSTSVDLPKLVIGPMAEGIDLRDPLNHDRITMRAFLSIRRAGKWAITHAGRLAVPALVLHGEHDDVADPQASLAFAAKAKGRCEVRLLGGQYHNVHLEPQPELYAGQIRDWLNAEVGRVRPR